MICDQAFELAWSISCPIMLYLHCSKPAASSIAFKARRWSDSDSLIPKNITTFPNIASLLKTPFNCFWSSEIQNLKLSISWTRLAPADAAKWIGIKTARPIAQKLLLMRVRKLCLPTDILTDRWCSPPSIYFNKTLKIPFYCSCSNVAVRPRAIFFEHICMSSSNVILSMYLQIIIDFYFLFVFHGQTFWLSVFCFSIPTAITRTIDFVGVYLNRCIWFRYEPEANATIFTYSRWPNKDQFTKCTFCLTNVMKRLIVSVLLC